MYLVSSPQSPDKVKHKKVTRNRQFFCGCYYHAILENRKICSRFVSSRFLLQLLITTHTSPHPFCDIRRAVAALSKLNRSNDARVCTTGALLHMHAENFRCCSSHTLANYTAVQILCTDRYIPHLTCHNISATLPESHAVCRKVATSPEN